MPLLTYQDCVFQVDRKNKMATLASDWLRHFLLLLWTEFHETWQEPRSQCALPSLCFSGKWENEMAAPASDWLRHFLLLWNHCTEFNETWQDLNVIYQEVFRADRIYLKNKDLQEFIISLTLSHHDLDFWSLILILNPPLMSIYATFEDDTTHSLFFLWARWY